MRNWLRKYSVLMFAAIMVAPMQLAYARMMTEPMPMQPSESNENPNAPISSDAATPQPEDPVKSAADIEAEQKQLSALLRTALMNNDFDSTLKLMKLHVDVNRKMDNGEYPIITATQFASVDVMKLLTAQEADVVVKDIMGRNALHYAAIEGNIEKIKLLRSFKVSVDLQDEAGVTPLYYAYLNEKLDAADYLVEDEGAMVRVADFQGNALAFRVIDKGDFPKVIEHMIKHKLDVFRRHSGGENMLNYAIKRGRVDTAKLIKEIYDKRLEEYQKKQQETQPSQAGEGLSIIPKGDSEMTNPIQMQR